MYVARSANVLGLLSSQAQSVLAIAAVVGQEFDIALVRRISNLSAGASGELMDEASEVGVVTLSSHDSYRFTHPLIRESLYKGLTEAERTRLHRAIGEALEQLHAANLTPHLAALAHHFDQAAAASSIRSKSRRRSNTHFEPGGQRWTWKPGKKHWFIFTPVCGTPRKVRIVKDDRLNSLRVSPIPGHGLTGLRRTPPQNSKAL